MPIINGIQIFTKRNNQFNYPNINWKINSKIFVKGEIDLGLNQKIVFNQEHSPSIGKVIKLGNSFIQQKGNIKINF